MWSLSLSSSLMACNWDLVKLGLGGREDLRPPLISTLSSSASCWPSLVQTASIAMMYSGIGGCLGVTAKLGPLANTVLWAWVKGLLNTLMTHLGLESSNELWLEDLGTVLDAWASVLAWVLAGGDVLAAWASVFSAWGNWDLTGEAGEGVLIAWISVPAWGTWALPGGDVLSTWGAYDLAREARGEALTAWAPVHCPEELFTQGLPTGGTLLN